MHVVYAREDIPESFPLSIFLAGPTPRNETQARSWRKEALRILEAKEFPGVVFVPEDRDGTTTENDTERYVAQVVWERKCLRMADCILFWIPRNLKLLPGFTTNCEFGEWFQSGKVVLGVPSDAEKVRYLEMRASEFYVPLSSTLEGTIDNALSLIGNGVMRSGGEREVPLYIWKTTAFENWHAALKHAGNRLDHASIEYVCRVGPKKSIVYLWVLHADVFVAKENRNKTNEIVVGRPDISSVIMYKRGRSLEETEIVLVREFRSPVSNIFGFVWELPGGSSRTVMDRKSLAAEEVFEETGFRIAPDRLRLEGVLQIAATLSSHRANLFSVELTEKEMAQMRSESGKIHGAGDSEQTYVEVMTIGKLLISRIVDWSTLGMILSVLR